MTETSDLPEALTARHAVFPASFAQQRLWFLDQYAPGLGLYNLAAAWHVRGALDPDALARSLQAMVDRHEALRTKFGLRDEMPVQIIAEHLPFKLSLTELPADGDAWALARAHLEAEAARPFELALGPLFRAELVRMDPREHILMLNVHHIVFDGWSMGVLLRELGALYESFTSGHTPTEEGQPIQYADYSVWQREQIQGAAMERKLGFWKRYLEGADSRLDLAADHSRDGAITYRGGSVPIEIGVETRQRLRALCAQERVTPFMALAAAFLVFLHRESRQEEVCVGYPAAGRTHSDFGGLIGFFVNTLVLRSRLSPRETFLSRVESVRESVLESSEHQDLPFELLVDLADRRRSLGHSPLFQAMLVLDDTRDVTLALGRLETEPLRIERRFSKFDITLELSQRGGRLLGELEYSRDLFEAATARRMAADFCALLDELLADPSAPLRLPGAKQPESLAEPAAETRPNDRLSVASDEEHARLHRAISAIWAEELGIAAIAPTANFFNFGGNSIRALKVINRIRGQLGIDIPLRSLFQFQTLDKFCDSVAQADHPKRRNYQPIAAVARSVSNKVR